MDTNKRNDIHIMVIPEEEKESESIPKAIMAEMSQIWGEKWISRSVKPTDPKEVEPEQGYTETHHHCQKSKTKNFESSMRRGKIYIQGNCHKTICGFLKWSVSGQRTSWQIQNIERNCQPRIPHIGKLFLRTIGSEQTKAARAHHHYTCLTKRGFFEGK